MTPTPPVVACLRITDLRPEVDPLTGVVRSDRWGIGLSAADGAALEHALRIGQAWSEPVMAIAVGPVSVEPVLRQVAALGASVLRVPVSEAGDGEAQPSAHDQQALARRVVRAVGARPSVVVCGDRSVDRGTGAFPAFLAHEFGAAQALGLVSLDTAPDGDSLMAERRLDGGWRERLRVPLPAVCSVEAAGVRLRRAPLAGALAAADSEVPVSPASPPQPVRSVDHQVRLGPARPFAPRTRVLPPPPGDDPRIRLLALTGALVAHDPPTVIGPVGSVEAADALIGFLVRHGYLDAPPDGEHPDATVDG